LCSVSPAAAELNPELKTPYRVQVVLRIAKHRLLTDVFKERVERELHDGLQSALGELAEIQVVREHPLLKDVEEKGLQQALDAWQEVNEIKTHFVLIDYSEGKYVIRTRQHDGLTGQASPLVREERIADAAGREFVARAAALLVSRDFGLVGTVTQKLSDDTVRVTLKGGGLNVPLKDWIKKNEVFILVQLAKTSGGMRATRVPWAVLQVQEEPADGACTCKFYFRHRDILTAAPLPDIRCLKISTLEQKMLRLRLVQTTSRGPVPPPTLQVAVRRHGFDGAVDGGQALTNAEGIPVNKVLFDHLAFVTVSRQGRAIARLPVPLLDDRPQVCAVTVEENVNEALFVRRNLWLQDVYASYAAQSNLLKELSDMLSKAEARSKVFDRAQAGLKDLTRDVESFTQARNELAAEAKQLQLNLADGDRALGELRKARDYHQKVVERFEQAKKEKDDPERKEALAKVQQAQLEEENSEFGKALELYKAALMGKLGEGDKTTVQTRVKELEEAWREKGDAHRRARAFIYKTWPTLDLAKTKDAVADARKAFEACQDAKDKLAPQKLLKIASDHINKLLKDLGGLQRDVNEDDQKTAENITKVSEELTKLIKDVAAYLQ